MKSSISKFLAVAAASLVCASLTSAQAAFISGSITFTGGADLDNAMGSATAFTSFFDVSVLSATEDYAPVLNESADFTPFTFAPTLSSPFELWTIKAGQYTFVATGITDYSQSPSFLNIAGTGYAHIDGKTDTPGIWTITDLGQTSPRSITFGSGVTAPVPDGGLTVLMLSAALSGLGLMKRKLS